MNYQDYFSVCKRNFKKEFKESNISIDKLGHYIVRPGDKDEYFRTEKEFNNSVKLAADYVNQKIENNIDLFDLSHKNIIKVNNWFDCQSIKDLGLYFSKAVEKHVYGCYTQVEGILIYKSLIGGPKRSSWLWHYDDNVKHQIKIMLYLNDVSDENGAIEFLMDGAGTTKKFKSSRISPSKVDKSFRVFGSTRLPSSFIDSQIVSTVTGPVGSFILFDPNTPHKATNPAKSPTRTCILYNFRPYHLDLKDEKICRKNTKTWSNLGNIKKFNTSTE